MPSAHAACMHGPHAGIAHEPEIVSHMLCVRTDLPDRPVGQRVARLLPVVIEEKGAQQGKATKDYNDDDPCRAAIRVILRSWLKNNVLVFPVRLLPRYENIDRSVH